MNARSGQYSTFFKVTCVVVFPFGMSTFMLLMPVALKTVLFICSIDSMQGDLFEGNESVPIW